MPDDRQFAPATQRNREPILDVLLQVLPPTGTVLEISSGTGEHAVFLRLDSHLVGGCRPTLTRSHETASRHGETIAPPKI